MNQKAKAELIVKVASEKRMSARIWEKDAKEIRVYLSRTNADRTEAGYVRLWIADGKTFSRLVCEGSGPGSRTAASEAESVYAEYKKRRDAAKTTQNQ